MLLWVTSTGRSSSLSSSPLSVSESASEAASSASASVSLRWKAPTFCSTESRSNGLRAPPTPSAWARSGTSRPGQRLPAALLRGPASAALGSVAVSSLPTASAKSASVRYPKLARGGTCESSARERPAPPARAQVVLSLQRNSPSNVSSTWLGAGPAARRAGSAAGRTSQYDGGEHDRPSVQCSVNSAPSARTSSTSALLSGRSSSLLAAPKHSM
mmetsp:Transcript_3106/g.8373  ORF Transcript_3106/g.8373 Transcript_3106/m.8373 type:complete len:215 (+) Transcript_3106:311-955(+)